MKFITSSTTTTTSILAQLCYYPIIIMHQTNNNRRLAAVSFLSNISLDGSYKDTGIASTLELAKDIFFHSNSNGDGGPDGSSGKATLIQSIPVLQDLELFSSYGENTLHGNSLGLREQIINEIAKSVSSRGGSISTDEDIFGDLNIISRKRFNTNESTVQGRRQQQDAGVLGRKTTHFSSTESIEQGGVPPFKGITNISTTNISESSLENFQKHDIKFINMCDVNPHKLSINNERLVVLVSKRSPWLIFSVIPYEDERSAKFRPLDRPEGSRRMRNMSGSRPVLTQFDTDPLEQLFHKDNEEVSYSYFIKPSFTEPNPEDEVVLMKQATSFGMSRGMSTLSTDSGFKPFGSYLATSSTPPEYSGELREQLLKSATMKYSPHLLDDAEFLAGKHRTLLTFSSYITSVIEYCKASDLKKELNDKLHDRFPQVQITLSKMRSLKREMRKVTRTDCTIDLLVVAQAYVYFEKLVLKSYVTKMNRKFSCGACLLLSAKMNDVKGQSLFNLIEVIERSFRVNKKELFKYEFAALVSLEFSLHIPTWEILPHYQRLLYES